MNNEFLNLILGISSSLIMLFLAGNIYFIKKLVTKIDNTAASAENALNSITKVSTTVANISDQLTEIKSEIKDLRRLEIEVAVIKSQINLRSINQDA